MLICVYSFNVRFEWGEIVALRHETPAEFLTRIVSQFVGHDCFVVTQEADFIWQVTFQNREDLIKASVILPWNFA